MSATDKTCTATDAADSLFDEAPHRIPTSIRHGSTLDQMEYLERHYERARAPHLFTTRASLPFAGRRFYLAVFFGREKRNLDRLRYEGQLDIWSLLVSFILLICVAVGAGTLAVPLAAFVVDKVSPVLITSASIAGLIVLSLTSRRPR